MNEAKEVQLKDKAINIKGKEYVMVKDRIIYFNETYPSGSITTKLESEVTDDRVVISAMVTPNVEKPTRIFTGYSQAKIGDGFINKTSALENAETSAVGRALAFMGIGVLDSVASADELNKSSTAVPEEAITNTDDFKALATMIREAKTPAELNQVTSDERYKTLEFEEKRTLSQRMAKSVMSMKG